MKKAKIRVLSVLMACFLLIGPAASVYAAPVTDEAVQAVIEQLEAIDTPEEMQAQKKVYAVKSRYDVYTTNASIIQAHENARAQYEEYLTKMRAARLAAEQAYNALTAEQKAQIDANLVEKLDDELETVFKSDTFAVNPRYDEYSFEAVKGFRGMAYEISNHSTAAKKTPATFILVDTSNGEETWTPSGKYVTGESNFEALYCCDVETGFDMGTYYKRANLEDADYFNDASAEKIRAIVENSYPYVTVDEMKANLKAEGVDAAFVDQLTRSDMIAAVQMAIWAYANSDYADAEANAMYGTSFDMTVNAAYWDNPMHDYNNELWGWWTTSARQYSYDAVAGHRVNTLLYHLCTLDLKSVTPEETIISDVEVVRADLTHVSEDIYSVGMYVILNGSIGASDDVKFRVTSSSVGEDGTIHVTSDNTYRVDGSTKYNINVKARIGDTIKVEVDGVQDVPKGVYLYTPEGGRSVSQTLVGVAEGRTIVGAETEFVLEEDIERGLRIYKTEHQTGLPISDITFHIYQVDPEDGEDLGEVPSEETVAKYAVEANKVDSVTTDANGYAYLPLEKGIYLVLEEHNTEKVKAPVDPFWVYVPMPVAKEETDGEVDTDIEIEYKDIVSVYPKNTPNIPPVPPPPPPPGDLKGRFRIVKHDAEDQTQTLSGAKFQVYRAAAEEDENIKNIRLDGVDYAVTPVIVDGEELVLVTGEDGTVTSPDLTCQLYFLVEIEAPAGYYLKGDVKTVMVRPVETAGVEVVYIANQKESLLPETGGIGTTAIYILGAVLVLSAGVILVSRRRMNSL